MPRLNRKRRARRRTPPVSTYVEGERLTLNKASEQAYFYLPDEHGRKQRFYMGRYYADAEQTTPRQKTLQRAADWIRKYRVLKGPPPADDDDHGITVADLVSRYMAFAKDYYRFDDGTQSREVVCLNSALKPVLDLYGHDAARQFSPLKLQASRDAMVQRGWMRKSINKHIHRVRRVFRWAVAQELIPSSVHEALRTVDPLKRGRTEAKEGKKRKPVAETHVNAVIDVLPSPLAAMVRIQWLTGMRPGEVCIMRPCDINREKTPWIYSPSHHKTEHLDHERFVALGPECQTTLTPFLLRRRDAFLFSPAESESERRQKVHDARVTPLSCGNVPGSNRRRNPQKQPGHVYTVQSYCRAVRTACDKAKVPVWTPARLRHTAATRFTKNYGLETARILLGHRDSSVTAEHYAEMDRTRALQIMQEIG